MYKSSHAMQSQKNNAQRKTVVKIPCLPNVHSPLTGIPDSSTLCDTPAKFHKTPLLSRQSEYAVVAIGTAIYLLTKSLSVYIYLCNITREVANK